LANVERSRQLQMKELIPWWTVAAIPAVVSSKYFDSREPYTANTTVSGTFWAGALGTPNPRKKRTDVDASTQRVVALTKKQVDRRQNISLGLDDKGVVDFVRLSFWIFGPSAGHLIDTYYLILLASCSVFCLAFFRRHMYLYCLAAVLIVLWLIQPMIRYNDQLTSLLALRCFPLISLPACLHCVLTTLGVRQPLRWPDIAFWLSQLLVVVFATHVRVTAMWEIAVIGIVCGVTAFSTYRRRQMRTAIVIGALMLASLASPVALSAYQYLGYSKMYRQPENIASRPFWHNIYSGLAFNREFAARYRLRIDDVSVIRAAGEYLTERGRASEWAAMGGTSDGYSKLHYTAYEAVVREMMFDRCYLYFGNCLAATLIDRPLATGRFVAWLYGLHPLPTEVDLYVSEDFGDIAKKQMIDLDRHLRESRYYAVLWHPGALAFLLMFSLLAASRPAQEHAGAVRASSIIAVGSLATVIIGYPAPWTIPDVACTLGTLFYCWAAVGMSLLYHRLVR
jgi:hypothetical protein